MDPVARNKSVLTGVGLGLRRPCLQEVRDTNPPVPWYEIAPENYIGLGGKDAVLFEEIAERTPIGVHGLQLSIGSLDALDFNYLKKLKVFLNRHRVPHFTDHLCFSSFGGRYFHDLLPLPLTQEAIDHVVERSKIVQDFLEIPFGLENISYYIKSNLSHISETDFILEILDRAKIGMLLDINNIYVNSINLGFDAWNFLEKFIGAPILQIHMAGPEQGKDALIDTHGALVPDAVIELFKKFLSKSKTIPPVLLERDENIPPLSALLSERQKIEDSMKEVVL